MKKQVILRWLWCILEYLMFFPAVLILAGVFLPYRTVAVLLPTLPVHLLFGLVLTSGLKKVKNYVIVLAGTVYTAIVTAVYGAVISFGSIDGIIVVVAGTVFFYIWGIRSGTGESTTRLFLYTAGLIIHIISLFLISNIDNLKPYFIMAMCVSIFYCIGGLPLANRRFLINETYEKSSLKTIPGSVNRGNIITVSIILACIIILSFWRFLLDAFVFLAEQLGIVILKIIEFLGSLYEDSEGGMVEAPPEMPLPPAEEQNSVVPLILNVISLILFAFILFLLIRYIVRNYKRIYYALYSLLSSFFSRFQKWGSTEQGYFDREESLLKTEVQKGTSVFRRLFRRWPKWRDMKDNESRVRFLYAKFVTDHMKKGFKLRLSDTPAEVVKSIQKFEGGTSDHTMLGEVYNSVRYGAKKADDDTVRMLRDKYL